MADRKGMMEIEDVLSSIRRLVAADTRPAAAADASGQAPDAADRLVLTPAQRIDEADGGEAAPAPGASGSLRAWEEDTRADRGTAGEVEEDIEATLAALEAELDSDLADEPTAAFGADGDDVTDEMGAAPAFETNGLRDAEAWDDPAELPGADAEPETDDDLAEVGVAPDGDTLAKLAGADGPTEGGFEEMSEGGADDLDAGRVDDWAEDDLAAAMADLADAPADIAPEPAADVAPDTDAEAEVAAAAPFRAPRSGFIWEGGFDDAVMPDPSAASQGLSQPVDDAVADAAGTGTIEPDLAEIIGPDVAEPEDGLATAGDLAFGAAADPVALSAPLPAEDVAAPPADWPADWPGDGAADGAADGATDWAADGATDGAGNRAAAWSTPEPDDAAGASVVPPAPAAGLSFDPEPGETEEDLAGAGLFDAEDGLPLDEAALRDLVAEVLRDELRGPLGARIARSLRQIVRQELARELAARGLSDDG